MRRNRPKRMIGIVLPNGTSGGGALTLGPVGNSRLADPSAVAEDEWPWWCPGSSNQRCGWGRSAPHKHDVGCANVNQPALRRTRSDTNELSPRHITPAPRSTTCLLLQCYGLVSAQRKRVFHHETADGAGMEAARQCSTASLVWPKSGLPLGGDPCSLSLTELSGAGRRSSGAIVVCDDCSRALDDAYRTAGSGDLGHLMKPVGKPSALRARLSPKQSTIRSHHHKLGLCQRRQRHSCGWGAGVS